MKHLCHLARLVATMSLLLAAPLSAQDARLSERLAAEARTGVEAEIREARAQGLPVEPLVQKALEGAARGAEGSRIVAVVHGLRERLAAARGALGDSATESELVAAAGALYVDVPPDAIRALREGSDGSPVDVPLVVLADMVQRGVPVEAASGAVIELRRAGADPDRYHLLRYRVEQDILSGTPPSTSVAERSRAILRSLRGGFPPRAPGA